MCNCEKYKKIEKIKEIILEIRKLESEAQFQNQTLKEIKEKYAKIRKEKDKLNEMGIELECTDYGDEYCLDIRGIEVVLKAIGVL